MLSRFYLATFVLSAIGRAAPSQSSKSPFIINGTPASQGEFPYIVTLLENENGFFCAGSLLNSKNVLTAAHCFNTNDNAGTISVRAGSLQRSSGGTSAAASQIVRHPGFNRTDDTSDFDIAILKLSSEITAGGSIAFAPLESAGNDPGDGSPATIAGWGLTNGHEDPPNPPENLLKAQYSVVGRAFCQDRWGPGFVTNNMFCTQGDGKGSCSGDSGGPVVVAGKVAGVQSFSNENCDSTQDPDVNTRIGTFRDFIDQNSS